MEFRHLKEKKISYCDHMKKALWIAGQFALVIPKMIIHGIYPDIYTEVASNISLEIIKKTYPERLSNKKKTKIS